MLPEVGKQLLAPGMIAAVAAHNPAALLNVVVDMACSNGSHLAEAGPSLTPAAPAVATWLYSLDLSSLTTDQLSQHRVKGAAAILAACHPDSSAAAVWPEGAEGLYRDALRLAEKLLAALDCGLEVAAHAECAGALVSALTALDRLKPATLTAGAAHRLLRLVAGLARGFGGANLPQERRTLMVFLLAPLRQATVLAAAAAIRAAPAEQWSLIQALGEGVAVNCLCGPLLDADTPDAALQQRLINLDALARVLEAVFTAHCAEGCLLPEQFQYCVYVATTLQRTLNEAQAARPDKVPPAYVSPGAPDAPPAAVTSDLLRKAADRAALLLGEVVKDVFRSFASDPHSGGRSKYAVESALQQKHAEGVPADLTEYLSWPAAMLQQQPPCRGGSDSGEAGSAAAACIGKGAWSAADALALFLEAPGVAEAAANSESSNKADLVSANAVSCLLSTVVLPGRHR